MLTKLFSTADGKIPFVQIILGIILGAAGMYIYFRFYKQASDWLPCFGYRPEKKVNSVSVDQPKPSQQEFTQQEQFIPGEAIYETQDLPVKIHMMEVRHAAAPLQSDLIEELDDAENSEEEEDYATDDSEENVARKMKMPPADTLRSE